MQQLQFNNKNLARLILPLALEQLLLVTVGMADTMMVSGVGEAAVSGISLVDSINVLLIQLFAALATGGAVVASQYLGKRDRDGACKTAKQLLYITTAMAIVVAVLSVIFNRYILHFVFRDLEPAVMQAAETYFWLSAASYPFLAIYNAGAALFRSMGNSKVSLYASILMNVVNISGNAILIYIFNMGVAGAAIASLVSRALAAIMIIKLLHNNQNPIFLEKLLSFKPNKPLISSILRIGIPSGVENSMFQVGKLILAGLIASFGTASITANAIWGNIVGMGNIPGNAIALTLITVVGQCVGNKDYIAARKFTKKLMKICYLCMLLTNGTLLLCTDFLIGLYNTSAATAALTSQICYITLGMSILFWTPSFALPSSLRAAGDAKFTMGVSLFSMWTFRIGLCYLFAYWGLGMVGIMLGMFVDWLVRGGCFAIRFHGKKWENIKVI